MKIVRNLTVAGCSLLLLTQCATQDEVRELNYQLRAVNQKVDDVKNTTVNQVQKRQASSVNKIDQVESETLRLQSMIEESAHQTSLYKEQAKEDIANLQAAIEAMQTEQQTKMAETEMKITALEQQVAFLRSTFEKEQQQRVQEAQQRAREAARRAEEAKRQTVVAAAAGSGMPSVQVRPVKKKVKVGNATVVDGGSAPQPASTSSVSPAPQSSPAEVETIAVPDATAEPFSQAMQQYRAKKYQDAYRGFEQVLSENPQGTRAAETLFYMGESLFFQGEYDLAILDYQKVISNHARSALTPQALLKQGMSFEKLTDHETAKIIYKKLINDYASSPEAGQAKSRLANL